MLFAPVASAQLSMLESVSEAAAATIHVADVDGVETEPANPFCFITGPTGGSCGGAPAVFVATAPSTPQTFNATWSLHSNTAGASFVGPSSCFGVLSCQATVATASQGSVIVRVTLNFPGGVQKTCQVTYTVTDTSPPTIICPAALTVPCGGSIDPLVTGTPTVSDCSPTTVTFVDTTTGGGCAGANITRTWTATDSGGLFATCVQTITRTSAVSIQCPPPITVQCFSEVPAPFTGSVTASDICGGVVTVTHEGDSATNGTSNCNNIITRTYMVVNGCGNSATCTQTITVNDTTIPSITCPGPVNVQCFSQVPAPNIGSVTASDNCGGAVSVTHFGDSASNGTSSCNNVITRTYRAMDTCGNQAFCTQTITVNDTTIPSITCPGPVNVQCFSQVPLPNPGAVVASDNCGGFVGVAHVGDAATNGTSSCNNVITRTYQATDACGNQNTCTQTITVNDTTPPTVLCPGPISFQCFSQVPAPATIAVNAFDNCGGPVTVAHVSDVATNGTSSCNNVITRTYSGTDACGNQNTCTQTITVNDTTPPNIQCPGPVSVQCFSLVPPPAIGSVIASDNCGGPVTVAHVSSLASNGTSSCNNVITRTYSATDACGNQNTCTQTITVNDTTPPTLACPGPVIVQCFSLVPPPAPGSVTAVDNCGGAVNVVFLNDVASNGTSSCNNVITRTYQGTDLCGNVQTCTQTITVNDTTLPTISCQGPLSFQCFSQVPAASTTTVTASDNCGGAVVLAHVSDVASNGTSSCNNIITRTYSATDVCGNQNTCTQIITVNDTTAPTVTCPGPVSVQCFSAVPQPAPGSVTTSDNCGGAVNVVFVNDVASNGTSSCNNVITRTYRGTDLCGNQQTCTQLITVNDTLPPVISCPPMFGALCGTSIDPTITGMATAIDNCDPLPVIGFTDVTTGGCPTMTETVTRTWTATDACGNMASCIQIITLTGGGGAIAGCAIDLGGGCGSPTAPILTSLLTTPPPTLSLFISGAAPNAPGVLGLQFPPFQTLIPLATPCALGIDPASPATSFPLSFNTDPTGAWSIAITPLPAVYDVRLQGAIFAAAQPAGIFQLTNAIEVARPGPCPPCTYNRPEWAATTGPEAANYAMNWLTVFPTGMDIGLVNGGAAGFGIHWTGDAAGRNALKTFLQTFGGLPMPTLIADATNPTVSTTGSFGRLLAVLQLNIAFNAAGFLGGSTPGFGGFIYNNPGNPGDSLNGFTVSQILTVCNQVISGAVVPPAGYTIGNLVNLLEDLHTAFDDCVPSSWSMMFLS